MALTLSLAALRTNILASRLVIKLPELKNLEPRLPEEFRKHFDL